MNVKCVSRPKNRGISESFLIIPEPPPPRREDTPRDSRTRAAGFRFSYPHSPPLTRKCSHDALLAMAPVQAALGVATLLLHVPVTLGAAHQAGAPSSPSPCGRCSSRAPPKQTNAGKRVGSGGI